MVYLLAMLLEYIRFLCIKHASQLTITYHINTFFLFIYSFYHIPVNFTANEIDLTLY